MNPRRTVLSMTLATVAFASFAETKVWYHFNEGTLDKNVGSSVPILNAVDPGRLVGKCKQVEASGAFTETDSGRTPMSKAAFPAGCGVYDHVSGAKLTNERGFYFHPQYLDAGWTSSCDTGVGTAVTAANDGSLNTQSFTAECFFKSAIKNNYASGYQLLISLSGVKVNCYSWALIVNKDGSVIAQMHDSNGKGVDVGALSAGVHDGKWHHAAITYNAATKLLAVYVDYQLGYSKTISGDYPYYASNGELVVGASLGTQYFRKWCGWIDEVKVSDVALSPNEFLREAPWSPEATTKDTACYVSFDQGILGEFKCARNMNCSTNAGVQALLDWNASKGRQPEFPADDKPGATVKGGVAAPVALADAKSMHLVTNTVRNSACVFVNDIRGGVHTALCGSWTVETFVKLDARPAGDSYLVGMHTGSGGAASLLIIATANGFLSFEIFNKNAGTRKQICYTGGLYDGKWHHVALTYDRDAKEASAYMDYKLLKTMTDCDFDYGVSSRYTPYLQVGGAYGIGEGHDLCGWIDDFRLSTRALKWHEFLNTRPVPADPDLLAWADFEAGFDLKPWADLDAAGVVEDLGAGTVPTRTTRCPGLNILDAAGEVIRENEERALALKGGMLKFQGPRALECCGDFTVEFWGRFPSFVGGCDILRLYADTARKDTVWNVGFNAAGTGPAVGVNTAAGGYQVWDLALTAPISSWWHHYAVSFERYVDAEDGGKVKTLAKLYCDYALVGSHSFVGEVRRNDAGISSSWLLAMNTSAQMRGSVDEFRVLRGAREPVDFLRVTPVEQLGLGVFIK